VEISILYDFNKSFKSLKKNPVQPQFNGTISVRKSILLPIQPEMKVLQSRKKLFMNLKQFFLP